MELSDALDQIAEIHDHISRNEVYRGYRPIPVAASGVCGLAAAGIQPWIVAPADGTGFLRYWIVAGIISALVAASGILYNYLVEEDEFSRRKSRCVVGQLVPSLATAVLMTIAILQLNPVPYALLPGLWALFFGVGVFASRPYMPRATGWVALYYIGAGTFLLSQAGHPNGVAYWGVGLGIVFGIGQLASALMLYLNIERSSSCAEEI